MINVKIDGEALYQWDTDRHVMIYTDNGETVSDVEFSVGHGDLLTVECETDSSGIVSAPIPNILLQQGKYIVVYVCAETANGERTIAKSVFDVIMRPKPSDYVYTETELKNYDALESRVAHLEEHASASSLARIGNVTIFADNWIGETSPYSQIVEVDGVTENSQVDLTPDVGQLAVFYEKDLAFVTENVGGVVTVYAIGQKPTNDYTMQVTITEVTA